VRKLFGGRNVAG